MCSSYLDAFLACKPVRFVIGSCGAYVNGRLEVELGAEIG
jgi:hypothetical protein